VRWQAELWRRLRSRVQLPSTPELLDAACDRLRAGEVELDLPERLSVFGTSRLSRARLQVLAALAEHRDVHLWLHHASPALWDAVATGPSVLRRADDSSADRLRNPLLVSLSRDVRELQQLLRDRVPGADVVHHEGQPRPRPCSGACRPTSPVTPYGPTRRHSPTDDRSVQVHSCHGRTRQVEVLREVVLGLLAADPTLEPRDVLVMCPDVETFAPLIAATFALGPRTPPRTPAARLRVRLADRALRQTNPLLSVLSLLVELGTARVTSSQVLDLAGTPAVRQRFGFDDDDLERLREWTTAAGIRWGFDAEHRSAWHLGGLVQGTWREGLDRLLLGAVTEGSSDDVTPLDDVDSAAIDLAGRFCELVDRLDAALAGSAGSTPRSPGPGCSSTPCCPRRARRRMPAGRRCSCAASSATCASTPESSRACSGSPTCARCLARSWPGGRRGRASAPARSRSARSCRCARSRTASSACSAWTTARSRGRAPATATTSWRATRGSASATPGRRTASCCWTPSARRSAPRHHVHRRGQPHRSAVPRPSRSASCWTRSTGPRPSPARGCGTASPPSTRCSRSTRATSSPGS
jgi:hypothetical protein